MLFFGYVRTRCTITKIGLSKFPIWLIEINSYEKKKNQPLTSNFTKKTNAKIFDPFAKGQSSTTCCRGHLAKFIFFLISIKKENY